MVVYGIVGAGGYGREVMPVALEMLSMRHERDYELVFVDEHVTARSVNDYRVLTLDEYLEDGADRRFNIAVAGWKPRERIANHLIGAGARPFAIVAPNSICMAGNQIGEGIIRGCFTTITSNARIGRFFQLNTYSYVGHDCQIGDFVTFGPDVHCNGAVVVEDYAYVGTGAIIKQGTPDKPIIIGRGAVVGMGAVVTKSVPPYTTVIGNPALPMDMERGQ